MNTTPNTAANGGQILTDERALFELEYAKCDLRRNPCDGYCSLRVDDAWQGWQDRASFAAVPASEPVKKWPFVESPGDFTMRLSAALDTFRGNMVAAVRNVLIENPATLAAPVPVSGMPDLAKLTRYGDNEWAAGSDPEFGERADGDFVKLADVEALFPSPQAPDATNPTGETK